VVRPAAHGWSSAPSEAVGFVALLLLPPPAPPASPLSPYTPLFRSGHHTPVAAPPSSASSFLAGRPAGGPVTGRSPRVATERSRGPSEAVGRVDPRPRLRDPKRSRARSIAASRSCHPADRSVSSDCTGAPVTGSRCAARTPARRTR